MGSRYREKLIGIYRGNADATHPDGKPLYLLDKGRLICNYFDLRDAFRMHYQNTGIAYSYKTNGMEHVTQTLRYLEAYAEVVSGKEREEAITDGVSLKNIIFNGVTDDIAEKKDHVMRGGIVNADSIEMLKAMSEDGSLKGKEIGIRIELGKDDQHGSRFGMSTAEITEAAKLCAEREITISGIHCHVGGSRSIESWKYRANSMVAVAEMVQKITMKPLRYIDLGGHLYGRMDEALASQFEGCIPTFDDYAEAVGEILRSKYGLAGPQLILEPGTAIIGDAVSILAKVAGTKKRNGKTYATLDVSSYDCGMVADYKNLTIENLSRHGDDREEECVVLGYTCMEQDFINRNYIGRLQTGDIVRILNTGAYSISMKGPFICNPINAVMVDSRMNVI